MRLYDLVQRERIGTFNRKLTPKNRRQGMFPSKQKAAVQWRKAGYSIEVRVREKPDEGMRLICFSRDEVLRLAAAFFEDSEDEIMLKAMRKANGKVSEPKLSPDAPNLPTATNLNSAQHFAAPPPTASEPVRRSEEPPA